MLFMQYLPENLHNSLLRQLSLSTKSNNEIIIMGDLNAITKTLLSQWGFSQIIKKAIRTTDTSATLIDILFTNRPNQYIS